MNLFCKSVKSVSVSFPLSCFDLYASKYFKSPLSDKIFEKEGIQVYVDPKSFLYLKGTELDFTDGLSGTGFVFKNPNAKRTCGCGSSFSA